MLGFMLHRRFVCISVTGSVIAQLTACTSWRLQNIPPQQFTVQNATKPMRVVRRSGAVMMLRGARIGADTLYGTHKRSDAGLADTVVAIPLSDVQSIAVRDADSAKTVTLVAGIVVVAGAAVALVLTGVIPLFPSSYN